MTTSLFKLPIFTEEDPENGNPQRSLRQIDYPFALPASQYMAGGLKVDTAKYFFLEAPSDTAKKWIKQQNDEMVDNREELDKAFWLRFPMTPKQFHLPEALDRFYKLLSKRSDL